MQPDDRCPACGGASSFFDSQPRSKSCNDFFNGRKNYPLDLTPIAYFRCPGCGFIFSPEMRAWPDAQFKRDIYNADYPLCDPPFLEERPEKNSVILDGLYGKRRESLALLDYGGGSGTLAEKLRGRGWKDARSCDVFYGDRPPDRKFDVVTAFEVVEHVPDQRALFTSLARYLNETGRLLFTTRLQPEDIDTLKCDWWYASPRNGHLCFHTRKSLGLVAAAAGLSCLSRNDDWHVAARQGQAVAQELLDCDFPRSADPPLRRMVYAR